MTLETAAAPMNYGTSASGSSFYAAMRILPLEHREAARLVCEDRKSTRLNSSH